MNGTSAPSRRRTRRMRVPTGLVTAFVLSAAGPAGSSAQSVAVDHVFVFVSADAPEGRVLEDAGFVIMPDTSRHVGQGTASLSVMFENAYLELIWVDDAEEFAAVGLGMPERRADPVGSPFGLGLKQTGIAGEIPFATDPYESEWMGDMDPIRMARWAGSVAEPLIFVVPEALRWDRALAQEPTLARFADHDLELSRLTSVRLVGPGVTTASGALGALVDAGVVQVEEGDRHTAHLTFDGGTRGETLDLRPTLPVVLHY